MKTTVKKKDSGWQEKTLARMRILIEEADPEVVEEQKWKKKTNPDGVPVWSHDGMICTGETYKEHLRFTFSKGSLIKDPKGLFYKEHGGKTRAIIIKEGDRIDEKAFMALIKAAVALNVK